MNSYDPQYPIKVMIVEDHFLFREGLKRVLEEFNGVKLIGEAENGSAFLEQLKTKTPDIVFMDIKMPVMDGIVATGKALSLYPGLRIIIMTAYGEEQYLISLIQKGISGFILKNARVFEIEKAIELVSMGEQYFSSEINGLLAKRLRQFKSAEVITFSRRENEILQLLCEGHSAAEIAMKLNLSKRTIEGYKLRLMEKTNQSNVIKLILFALKNNLVSMDES
jgi:two-component system, NarL family, response regulator DegU